MSNQLLNNLYPVFLPKEININVVLRWRSQAAVTKNIKPGIGVIVALAGVISSLYDMNAFGVKFYIAIVSVNALIVLIFLLLRLLFRKTKELREL